MSAATSIGRDTRSRRGRGGMVARTVLAIVISVVIAFPLYWMVVVAFSSRSELLGGELRLWPRSLTLANFRQVLDAYPVGDWFSNSVAIAVVTSLISVVFSLLGGYALAQLRVKGANAVFLIMLSTLMIPVQVIMVSLFKIVTGSASTAATGRSSCRPRPPPSGCSWPASSCCPSRAT